MSFFEKTVKMLLLENGAHLSSLGMLPLVQVPFALKFLAAPFMDTYFFKKMGKRKSYIVPTQYFFCGICLCLSWYLDEEIKNLNIISIFFFGLTATTVMAIQDVAVDGWVLSLLSSENRAYGAFAQTTGLALGGIISFNIFIPLNSPEFCSRYLYFQTQDSILTIQRFWLVVGIFTLFFTILIHLFKKEKKNSSSEITSVLQVLKSLRAFKENPNLRRLLLVATSSCICIAPIYALMDANLMQRGFPKETLTNIITMLIPFHIFVSFCVSKLCKNKMEMKLKFWVYCFSYINYLFLFFAIQQFQREVNYGQTLYLVIFGYAMNVIGDAGHFISDGSYWNRVCDEAIGGTFLTILAAATYLGFLLPESVSLFLSEFIEWKYMGWFFILGTPFYLKWYKKQMDHLHTKSAKDFEIYAKKLE